MQRRLHLLLLRAERRRLEQTRCVLTHDAVTQPSVAHARTADWRQDTAHAVGRAEKGGKIGEAGAAQGGAVGEQTGNFAGAGWDWLEGRAADFNICSVEHVAGRGE